MIDEDTRPAIVLPIEGMSCGACVSRVDAALRSVPGVTEVAVAVASAASRPPTSPVAALVSAIVEARRFVRRPSRVTKTVAA